MTYATSAVTNINNTFEQSTFSFYAGGPSANVKLHSNTDDISELKEQIKQLNQVIDVMPTGMIILDGNGVVVKINDVARELLDD